MNNVHLSIWGIRDGFEKTGMFHTHDIAELKKIQQDRFRDIGKMLGSAGFYMIHRQAGYTMVSFVNTGIREASTSSQMGRPGYVAFSLIFSDSLQLMYSPRIILKEIALFYAERVKDGTKNNFHAEEIQIYLSTLATKQRTGHTPPKAGSFYTYYNDENQVDEFLIGDTNLTNLSEWVWIYNSPDARGNYTHYPFWEGAFNVTPEYFDVTKVREVIIKEEEDRRRLEEERNNERKRQEINLQALEADLNRLLLENKELEAVNLWRQSPLKNSVSNPIKSRLFGLEQSAMVAEAKAQKEKEDNHSLEELHKALNNNDLDLALICFRRLNNPNHPNLSEQVKHSLLSFENNKRLEKEQKEEERRNQRIKEEKNAKRKKIILIGSIALVIGLCISSYFSMIPAVLWDSDGDGFHTYRQDKCPEQAGKCMGCPDQDNDGVADQEDECKDIQGISAAKGCPDADGDGTKDANDQCPTVPGTLGCNGCPDADGDNVTDTLDNCPNEKGMKQYNGCTQDPMALQRAQDKAALELGHAVKVSSEIGNFKVANKWLTFTDGHYLYSDYEKKNYKPVETQEMVNVLNAYYGLKGTLKPKPTPPPGPKPPSGGLTQAEQAELNRLVFIKDRPLREDETKRKKALENKAKRNL